MGTFNSIHFVGEPLTFIEEERALIIKNGSGRTTVAITGPLLEELQSLKEVVDSLISKKMSRLVNTKEEESN